MKPAISPWVRILVRYAVGGTVGYAVAHGILPEELASEIAADPEVSRMLEVAVATAVMAITEWWYVSDKKKGKPT